MCTYLQYYTIISIIIRELAMKAVIFDIDHTIFTADKQLREGVADLLAILQRLGVKVGALSSEDHRALVYLDEAGIRDYFESVRCSSNDEAPKAPPAVHALLKDLDVALHHTALVSHAHSDILLGKDAGVAKTIGVSHGRSNVKPLEKAGADHIVADVPAVLDVLH